MTYARNHVFERSAVQDERAIFKLQSIAAWGKHTYGQVRHEFAAERHSEENFVALDARRASRAAIHNRRDGPSGA